MPRPIAALLAVAILTGASAGCTAAPIPRDRPEPARSAPEPVPSGALYGRILRQDGRPATRSSVEAYQLSTEDKARLGVAVLSLGFFCLVPGFCPRPVSAKVNDDGGYAFPTDKVKATPSVTVTARHAADPGQVAGPVVVASFDHPTGTTQRVPDLRYWEPAVTVRHTGSAATLGWTALGRPARYAVWTVVGTGSPEPTGVETDGTSATLDLRPYEDAPTAVVVVATTTDTVAGTPVTFAYHAGSVPLPSAGAPPSRGRPCRVGTANTALVEAAAPCPLTDGDLDTNATVPVPCPSGTAAPSCFALTPHRICVDLGPARPVSLVVYRTPFNGTRPAVELSPDGVSFTRATMRVSTMDSDIVAVPVDPPTRAVLVCVRDDGAGLAGAVLDELSAW